MKHRLFLPSIGLIGLMLALVPLGCSPEPTPETIPAETQPSFKEANEKAPGGGGMGLGNPMLNPNFKPTQRRNKNLKVPSDPK